MLSLTSPSMMAGSWVSMRFLQAGPKSGRSKPRISHNWSTKLTISCSVLSLVIQLSMAVTVVTHSVQVMLSVEDKDGRNRQDRTKRVGNNQDKGGLGNTISDMGYSF